MKTGKENILTAVAIVILLATAMISWDLQSWLILLAVIVLLLGWYFRK